MGSGSRPSHRIAQLNLEKNLDRSANPLNANNLVGTKVAKLRNPELPLLSPKSLYLHCIFIVSVKGSASLSLSLYLHCICIVSVKGSASLSLSLSLYLHCLCKRISV